MTNRLFVGNMVIGCNFNLFQNRFALSRRIPNKVDNESSVASNVHSNTGLFPNTRGYGESTCQNTVTESHMAAIALDHTVDTILDSQHLQLNG